MYIYKGHGKVLLTTLLISTLIWVLIVLVSWMVYMAFHTGSSAAISVNSAVGTTGYIAFIPIRYFYIFLPVISVIMSLPISFAGLGIREGVFIELFDTLPGISGVDGLIISLTFYFVFLAVSLIGGVIYILKGKLRVHRDIILPAQITPPGGAE